jgi:formylglycine-generating enzyme
MARGMAIVAAAAVMWACVSRASATVNIETVPVGNPGNAGDTRYPSGGVSSFGAVAYTYNIGKYEVTAGQYCEFLNKVARTDTYGLYNTNMSWTDYGSGISRSGWSGNYTYNVTAAFVNRPVNYVNWGDAARFANWLHNGQPTGPQGLSTTEDGAYFLNGATTSAQLLAVTRRADWRWAIPSADEWYKAAYYKSGSTHAGYWDYPTRSDTVPGQDLADLSGNNANYIGSGPYPIDAPYYTTVAGEFQNSESPYGTFDQGGNVREWNEGVADGTYRGLRGGSFSYSFTYLRPLLGYSIYVTPMTELNDIGFRVSQAPEPATIVVLASAGLGLLRRRRG